MTLIVRRAMPSDASGACDVVRRSILQLCVADHGGDAATIAAWLANKTAENFASWIGSAGHIACVAEVARSIAGFALLNTNGTIALLYVAPEMRFQGVSKALLRELEARALALGISDIDLDSSATALPFYEACGYSRSRDTDAGFGISRKHPMTKRLARSSGPVMEVRLVVPSLQYLQQYVAALNRGWSPDNIRKEVATIEELEHIERDAEGFIASMVDREAKGAPIKLPDGSAVPRLPGYRSWIWDGEFCGSIGFRWQPGTETLPPHVLGHIGYAVVPWKQRRGYATRALRLMLAKAAEEGLRRVQITTDAGNVASQRVIEANGGVLVERFTRPEYGPEERLRYRVPTSG
jgi:predicted acetyltransferase/GNAT superfamily N-acetyltransferase